MFFLQPHPFSCTGFFSVENDLHRAFASPLTSQQKPGIMDYQY